MAALVGAGAAVAAAAEGGAGGKIADSSSTGAKDEINFEAEAQARGMQMLSCTRVSKAGNQEMFVEVARRIFACARYGTPVAVGGGVLTSPFKKFPASIFTTNSF